jgi:GR25 family glycosyltransferase involved in LPS biosynthesis
MFSLNDYFNKVYVIHMESDKHRMPRLLDEFKKVNTTFTLKPGIVPTQDDRDAYASPLCRSFCSKSMIGIYLAHRKLWEEIVANELPSAVIFEDDVVFTKDIETIFPKAIQELPKDWELLHLGCLSCHESTFSFIHLFTNWSKLMKPNLAPYSKHLAIPETTFGTEAYAVTLEGARKLLTLLPNGTNHADFMISMVLPQLKHFSVYPQVAYQDPEGFKHTNNGASSPVLLNNLASHVRLQSSNPYNFTTLTYALSIPIGQVKDTVIINAWSILFFACGLIHPWSGFGALAYVAIDFMYALSVNPNKIKSEQYAFYIYMISIGMVIRYLL